MIVNYSDQEVIKSKNSIFLASPTPRKIEIKSYRKEAIEILEKIGFNGVVYVPELGNNQKDFDYTNQIDWETEALNNAGVIVFWIPRSFPDMPAFTTNVEFGEWYKEDKTFYGRPNNSRKNRYLDKKYLLYTKRLPYSSLENLLKASVDKLNGEYIDLRASTEYCILEYIMAGIYLRVFTME